MYHVLRFFSALDNLSTLCNIPWDNKYNKWNSLIEVDCIQCLEHLVGNYPTSTNDIKVRIVELKKLEKFNKELEDVLK